MKTCLAKQPHQHTATHNAHNAKNGEFLTRSMKTATWRSLSMAARLLFCALSTFRNGHTGATFPSTAALVQRSAMSRRTVIRARLELVEKGVLQTRQERPGRSALRYELNPTFDAEISFFDPGDDAVEPVQTPHPRGAKPAPEGCQARTRNPGPKTGNKKETKRAVFPQQEKSERGSRPAADDQSGPFIGSGPDGIENTLRQILSPESLTRDRPNALPSRGSLPPKTKRAEPIVCQSFEDFLREKRGRA